MVSKKQTRIEQLPTLALVAGAALLFGIVAGRLWQSTFAGARPHADRGGGLPLHDNPSGYFSARGEGSMTNTPQTHMEEAERPAAAHHPGVSGG